MGRGEIHVRDPRGGDRAVAGVAPLEAVGFPPVDDTIEVKRHGPPRPSCSHTVTSVSECWNLRRVSCSTNADRVIRFDVAERGMLEETVATSVPLRFRGEKSVSAVLSLDKDRAYVLCAAPDFG
jgi:hypothetical protein